ALFTNHKPEPHARLQPSSQPHSLRDSLRTTSHACLSLVYCISTSHAIERQRGRVLAEVSVVHYACALLRSLTASTSGVKMSSAYVATVEYPSPNMKITGSKEQALLTNHTLEPHVRCHPSESTKPATQLLIYCSYSCLPLVVCISLQHAIGTQRDRGLAEASVSSMSAP
uniref:Secreted protein n=1 Tax=Mesocestoides corti TaxID=53468 RepID=A0A5K3FZJ5_MESCO